MNYIRVSYIYAHISIIRTNTATKVIKIDDFVYGVLLSSTGVYTTVSTRRRNVCWEFSLRTRRNVKGRRRHLWSPRKRRWPIFVNVLCFARTAYIVILAAYSHYTQRVATLLYIIYNVDKIAHRHRNITHAFPLSLLLLLNRPPSKVGTYPK